MSNQDDNTIEDHGVADVGREILRGLVLAAQKQTPACLCFAILADG